MPDSKVKGDILLRILDQVIAKWGVNGLDIIGYDPSGYREEQWYPFPEICGLLAAIKSRLGNNNPLSVYQMGFRTVKEDSRWQGIFEDMDPGEVFLTTSRQDAQYVVGEHRTERLGPKHVRLDLLTEERDPVWFEFYRGRLQGVLELTGRTGVVHLMPWDGKSGSRIFDIKWG